ncbi:MAG TPA: TetR family transcriptional regulator C-terminal domain-containing protein [Cyclobacteriaceae bacterium]
METTKKSPKKSAKKSSGVKIESAYVEYLLTEGKQPASVFKFCLDLGIKESDFYTQFGSFDAIESRIWQEFIDKTITRLRGDKSFGSFIVREKILAFYYTLFEELKANRSLVLFQLQPFRKIELVPSYLKEFKKSFESFFETILSEGKGNGEVSQRPYLDKRYPQLFWVHFGFILLFWKEDFSADFEKTDAAIEKSVNLAFDLIGKGALDSAIDFAKFMYQTKAV